jgi:hypothetical protein
MGPARSLIKRLVPRAQHFQCTCGD